MNKFPEKKYRTDILVINISDNDNDYYFIL